MNHSTNADNKRVKHWQRVSPMIQTGNSGIPASAAQLGSPLTLTDRVKRISKGQNAPPASAKKAAQESESLGSWDNEGGTINPPSLDPKP